MTLLPSAYGLITCLLHCCCFSVVKVFFVLTSSGIVFVSTTIEWTTMLIGGRFVNFGNTRTFHHVPSLSDQDYNSSKTCFTCNMIVHVYIILKPVSHCPEIDTRWTHEYEIVNFARRWPEPHTKATFTLHLRHTTATKVTKTIMLK